MPRYRVEVTRVDAYLVDADTPEYAASKGIALAKARVKPDYPKELTADVDVVAETETVGA